METRKKHKLVIISDSGLLQRHFDIFYIDNLCSAFDLEYWDCSKILLKKEYRVQSAFKRSYDVKINSLWRFNERVKHLPKDTLIIYFALLNTRAYLLNRVLSSHFMHIIRIRVSMIIPNALAVNVGKEQERVTAERRRECRLKKVLKKPNLFLIGVKMLFRPEEAKAELEKLVENKIYSMYKWHVMSCEPGSLHHINASNFEKYMRSKEDVADRRFVVYVDQYFPYHKELSLGMNPAQLEMFALTHFSKLNSYFEKIEKAYKCPIIIAAHPLSQYSSNPFNGREIQYGATDKLISECEGVVMHNSGSITYVILNDKPVVLLCDSEYKQCIWYNGILNLHQKYGIDVVSIDDDDAKPIIKPLPKGVRENLIRECCGEVDEENFVYNDVLLVKCLNDIYKEINEKSE